MGDAVSGALIGLVGVVTGGAISLLGVWLASFFQARSEKRIWVREQNHKNYRDLIFICLRLQSSINSVSLNAENGILIKESMVDFLSDMATTIMEMRSYVFMISVYSRKERYEKIQNSWKHLGDKLDNASNKLYLDGEMAAINEKNSKEFLKELIVVTREFQEMVTGAMRDDLC